MAHLEKYGNNNYWCFIEKEWGKEVAIWRGPPEEGEIIARATDKYEAKTIVDALIRCPHNDLIAGKLDKKETMFLEFVKATCPEPYATMAANTLMWNDKEAYKKLLSDFPVIYS